MPESFKVLIKELQSLCLDVRVLDKDGSEIELKDDDEDDFIPDMKDEIYAADDDEITAEGYSIEDVPEEEEDDFGGDSDDGADFGSDLDFEPDSEEDM